MSGSSLGKCQQHPRGKSGEKVSSSGKLIPLDNKIINLKVKHNLRDSDKPNLKNKVIEVRRVIQ